MKQQYTAAVLELLESGHDPEAVIAGLKASLEKHSHEKLLPAILQSVKRVLDSSSSTNEPVVVVASEGEYKKQKTAIAKTFESLGTNEEPQVEIDSTLIGGYLSVYKNRIIDKSYKSKLVSLYRNISRIN